MRFNFIKYCGLFVLVLLFGFSSDISAKEPLETAIAPGYTTSEAGKIVLYNDYTVTFYYGYRVREIVIEICDDSVCETVDDAENKVFLDNSSVEFDISKYVGDSTKKYTVTISANFKETFESNLDSIATLEYDILPTSSESDNKDVLTASEKAINFMNTWVIPGLYIILAVTVVIKGVLLSIDLVRYADNQDLRKEKIRGFTYVFIGVLVAAIINSSVGFVTGLFG